MEVNGTVLRCGWSRGTYVAVHGCGVGAAGDACVGWAAGVAVCGGLSQLGLVTCVEGGTDTVADRFIRDQGELSARLGVVPGKGM